jgi:hypothetical protein
MQRFSTYIILILTLAGGFLLLYRSFLKFDDFTVIEGKVLTKQFEPVSSRTGNIGMGYHLPWTIMTANLELLLATKSNCLQIR